MRPKCPKCGNVDQSRITGFEVRDTYNGVLVWQCQTCSRLWPRFPSGVHHDQAVRLLRRMKEPRGPISPRGR